MQTTQRTQRPAKAAASLPRIAVVSGGQWYEPSGYQAAIPTNLAALLNMAEARDVRQVWILNTYADPDRPNEYEPLTFEADDYADAEAAGWHVKPNRLSNQARAGAWLKCWRKGDPHWRDIVQTHLGSVAPWRKASTPQQLLTALLGYAKHTGVMWSSSGGSTGQDLMRLTLATIKTNVLPAATIPPPATHPAMLADGALVWMREPVEQETHARWLVSLDRNAAYLSAAGGVSLGLGEPQHITRGTPAGDGEIDTWNLIPAGDKLKYRAGLYRLDRARVELEQPHIDGLPDIIDPDSHGAWVNAPTLQLLAEQGYRAPIIEAWIYRNEARWLERWYVRLRDARTAILAGTQADDPTTRAAARLALAAVKQTYTQAISWLASAKWDRDGDPIYRPDAQQAIRAHNRVSFWRSMRRAYEQAGIRPFAASTDAWYYLTDEEPAEMAERAGYRLGDGLADWKLAQYEAAPLMPILTDPTRRPALRLGGLLEVLNKLDAERAAEIAERVDLEAE